MRHALRFLAASAAALVLHTHAADAQVAWSVSTPSSRGGAIFPAAVHSSAADANGDLFVVATQGDASGSCIVTIKYQRASGAIAWRQEHCAGAGTQASGMAVDAGGDVVVVGTTAAGMRVLKYAGANGVLRWDRGSGSAGDAGFAVAVDGRGDVVVLGSARAFTLDLWIAKHRGADGALAWQQPVEGGADTTPAGLALDASGNALVAGTYRNSRGDEDWHLAKLAGSSGAVLWRKVYDSGARDVASAVAVDGNGHIVVAGTSTGTQAAFRVVKSEGTTGRTVWQQAIDAGSRAGVSQVRFDAGNNPVAVGFAAAGAGNDIRTFKLSEHGGFLLWQATHPGGAGPANGRSVAFDAAGDVIVAGTTFTNGPEIRTHKLAGAGGERLWSAAHRSAAPGAADSGHAVVAAGSAHFTIGVSTEPQGSALRIIRYGERTASPFQPLSINVQGLWWRGPEESGWGLNVTQQGDVLFATWFTYDDQGQPQWLVMSEGRRIEDGAFSGTLYRTHGPAFNAVPFDPAQVRREPVGRATLRFADAQNGVFAYEVEGRSGSKPIVRQVFSGPQPQCTQGGQASANPNYQDLWWAPDGREAGWGLNIAHQGDTMFLTWFTYGADGRGTWLVASKVERTGSNTFAGTLYRTVGPPLAAQPWNASRVAVAAAGEVRLAFTDASSGTFSYTLDGTTQTKPLTRQVYATPKTVCR